MIRGIGSIFILSGCMGLGFWYREQIRGRIRALRLLQSIQEVLESEIRYSREPFPVCCLRLATRMMGPCSCAFARIAERMEENDGLHFETVFEEEMEASFQKMPLRREDKEDFFRCILKSGPSDYMLQLKLLEQSREILRRRTDLLVNESLDKSRMAIGLGAMGGFLILLILC